MNQQTTAKALKVVEYTNKKLSAWYVNAKEEYGINGFGVSRFDAVTNSIVIDFSENGHTSTFVVEDWSDEAIEYSFDVWMEFGECVEC